MAMKKSASTKRTVLKEVVPKKAPVKKPVPPMYTKPERVTYRSDDPTIDHAAVIAAMDVESRRIDFEGRLDSCATMLREIVLPHYGRRPGDFFPEQWADISHRERTLWELPASAPCEARDAFNGLRTIHRIRHEIKAVAGQPDAAQREVCWAIDLGLLLQRVQAQLYFGPTVAVGRSNAASRSKANSTKSIFKGERVATAKSEYRKREGADNRGSKTSILKSMAQAVHNEYDELGQRVEVRTYGSYGQLARNSKDW